jgi:hypothetical protein
MQQELVEFLRSIITALDWSDWVTSIATLILAILTFVYVRLTSKVLSSQSDPCVVLTVVHDEDRASILQLVAKNLGTGLAHDIRFTFSHPLPARAFGLIEQNARKAETMTEGPLINGIPALGPGEYRKIDWGQYGGLKVAIGDSKIIATCHFKKNSKEMKPVICPLDVESFSRTVAAESPASKTVKELEKISNSLGHFASGFHKLKVDITSMPEGKEI